MNDKVAGNREELERSIQYPFAPKAPLRFQLFQISWLHSFVLIQFLLQLLLLVPEISKVRILLRIGTFALSLGLLWKIPQTGVKHPAKPWAIAVLCIMALQLCWHPYLSSVPAGTAQCLMYLAILGPLFWVSRLDLTEKDFRWLIYLMWGFHTLSSVVGVLQIYYPDIFQFAVSSVIEDGAYGGEQLKITLANGQFIYRPSGLSDVPGAAATSGFYALLLGAGIALQERNFIFRLAGLASVPIGLFCIYLSQVRSTLIVSLVCLAVIALVLLQLRQFWKVITMACAMLMIVVTTTTWAVSIGGDMTSERFISLLQESPDTVVYQNRGYFLEETIVDLIPKFPMGAGLGRWGMMNSYFGNNYNPITYPIWAEIQWTGWVLDGGIPLALTYTGAILAACLGVWSVICDRGSPLQFWGALIFAYNVGAISLTFNQIVFISQTGMEFWLVNTALFVAAANARRQRLSVPQWRQR